MSKDIKALLLEDDEALAMGIEYSLLGEGYEVYRIASYKEGVEWLDKYKKDANYVALFDVMLPDGNGFDLLSLYRSKGVDFPVIFLTAVSDEINVVQGLDLGADDYISKPFRVKELLSRLNAVVRRYYRTNSQADSHIVNYRDISIHEQTANVYKKNEKGELLPIELTPSEYKLLLYFVHNQGILLERNVILERLFDSNGAFVDNNTLSVYIRRLREKIGDNDKDSPYIKTVHGVGYIMEK